MDDEVLTMEHLEAVKDLWFGLHPTFDLELFKANNPYFPYDSTNNNSIARRQPNVETLEKK